MINILFYSFMWLAVIIVHEAGHYQAFITAGYKPEIKIKWWGIEIGENTTLYLTPREICFNALSGISLGLCVFIMMGRPDWTMIYFFVSMVDITIFLSWIEDIKDSRPAYLIVQDKLTKYLNSEANK
jgi:hypothetical protein